MTTDDATRAGFSLRRWSARKHAAARDAATDPRPLAPVDAPAPPAGAGAVVPAEIAADAAHGATLPLGVAPAGHVGAVTGAPDDARVRTGAAGDATPVAAAADVGLPPIESLTPQSDFTPFMRPDVDPALKRAALRKLFTDPHFNVMDGLDVYIDDYSKPDPLPEGWLEKLNQMARLGAFQPQEESPPAAVPGVPATQDSATQAALSQAETPTAAPPPEPGATNVPADRKNDS